MASTARENPDHGRLVFDARDRSVTVVDPFTLQLLGRKNVIEREALDAILEELAPGARRRRAILLWLLPLSLIVVAGAIGLVVAAEGQPAWRDLVAGAMNPAVLAGCLGGIVTSVIGARQARHRKAPAVLLRHRRCPHCGYSLIGLPVDPADGATICPECACAWHLDAPDRVPIAANDASQARSRILLVATLLIGLAALAGFAVLYFMRHR
jgi:hypothetical protein